MVTMYKPSSEKVIVMGMKSSLKGNTGKYNETAMIEEKQIYL